MNLKVNRANIQNVLADNASMREFATFLLFKSRLKKSCAYNYTPETLAERFSLKKGMVNIYVKRFLERKWCRMHNGNLIFNPLSTMEPEKTKRVKVDLPIKEAVKEIMNDLYLLILKHKQRQFEWLKQLGRDHVKASRYKRKRKEGRQDRFIPDQNARLQVSIRTIASWFGCSIGKASSIIKRLKVAELITVIANDRQVIVKTTVRCLISDALKDVSGSYYHNGYVFKKPCNFYIF